MDYPQEWSSIPGDSNPRWGLSKRKEEGCWVYSSLLSIGKSPLIRNSKPSYNLHVTSKGMAELGILEDEKIPSGAPLYEIFEFLHEHNVPRPLLEKYPILQP